MAASALAPGVSPLTGQVEAPMMAPQPAPPRQPFLIGPPLTAPPSASFYVQGDQFQAAKYFTFIFFGLSCFVIMLFGGFVVCHCYRRLRRRRQGDDDLPVVQMSGHPSDRTGPIVIDIPMKTGRLVSQPDGGLEVAYIPDSPRSPEGPSKSLPPTPATGDRPPPSPAADTPTDSPGMSQPGMAQLPTSSGASTAAALAAEPESSTPWGGVPAWRPPAPGSVPHLQPENGHTILTTGFQNPSNTLDPVLQDMAMSDTEVDMFERLLPSSNGCVGISAVLCTS